MLTVHYRKKSPTTHLCPIHPSPIPKGNKCFKLLCLFPVVFYAYPSNKITIYPLFMQMVTYCIHILYFIFNLKRYLRYYSISLYKEFCHFICAFILFHFMGHWKSHLIPQCPILFSTMSSTHFFPLPYLCNSGWPLLLPSL